MLVICLLFIAASFASCRYLIISYLLILIVPAAAAVVCGFCSAKYTVNVYSCLWQHITYMYNMALFIPVVVC